MTDRDDDTAKADQPRVPGKLTLLRRIALRLNGRMDRRLGDLPPGEHTDATRRRQEQARRGELDVERWRVAACVRIELEISELEAVQAARSQVNEPQPGPPTPPPGFPSAAWNARRAQERAAAWSTRADQGRTASARIAALRVQREARTQEARVAAAKWQVWFNEQIAIYERSRIRRRTEPVRLPPAYARAILFEMPPAVSPAMAD
jgi:hypothetical protein